MALCNLLQRQHRTQGQEENSLSLDTQHRSSTFESDYIHPYIQTPKNNEVYIRNTGSFTQRHRGPPYRHKMLVPIHETRSTVLRSQNVLTWINARPKKTPETAMISRSLPTIRRSWET